MDEKDVRCLAERVAIAEGIRVKHPCTNRSPSVLQRVLDCLNARES